MGWEVSRLWQMEWSMLTRYSLRVEITARLAAGRVLRGLAMEPQI